MLTTPSCMLRCRWCWHSRTSSTHRADLITPPLDSPQLYSVHCCDGHRLSKMKLMHYNHGRIIGRECTAYIQLTSVMRTMCLSYSRNRACCLMVVLAVGPFTLSTCSMWPCIASIGFLQPMWCQPLVVHFTRIPTTGHTPTQSGMHPVPLATLCHCTSAQSHAQLTR